MPKEVREMVKKGHVPKEPSFSGIVGGGGSGKTPRRKKRNKKKRYSEKSEFFKKEGKEPSKRLGKGKKLPNGR